MLGPTSRGLAAGVYTHLRSDVNGRFLLSGGVPSRSSLTSTSTTAKGPQQRLELVESFARSLATHARGDATTVVCPNGYLIWAVHGAVSDALARGIILSDKRTTIKGRKILLAVAHVATYR